MAIVGEGFVRMFQQAFPRGSFRRRHGGRQVDKPLWIGGEAAHDFQSGRGVLFADGDVVVETRGDDALAQDVINIQKIIELLLG
jgi:hypothetical protein